VTPNSVFTISPKNATPKRVPQSGRYEICSTNLQLIGVNPRFPNKTASFGSCSRPCGGGVKSRQVRCVKEISKNLDGRPNIVVMHDDQCSVPKPDEQQPCGDDDCPAQWTVGEWNQVEKWSFGIKFDSEIINPALDSVVWKILNLWSSKTIHNTKSNFSRSD